MSMEYVTFKEICSKIGSGATPTGGKEAYKGGGFKLVRSQNILDLEFSWDGLAEMLSLNSEFTSLSNEAKALESEIEKNLKELFG